MKAEVKWRAWRRAAAVLWAGILTCQAQDPVTITKDDASPVADGVSLTWDWTVSNNTYFAIDRVYLYDIYSSSEPQPGNSFPLDTWRLGASISGNNLWTVTLNPLGPNGFIPGQGSQAFEITTYRPDDSVPVAVQTRYGQVEVAGSPDPDFLPFLGPAGLGQGPLQFAGIGFDAATPDQVTLILTNLVSGSTCSVERCFDLAATNWLGETTFVAAGGMTNIALAVSNDWVQVFYRARVE